jgi:hypothetical protein
LDDVDEEDEDEVDEANEPHVEPVAVAITVYFENV